MGPGLYCEIGKKARDLLYKDYNTDQRFVLTTCTSNGVAVLASGVKKDDLIFGEILSQIRSKNFTVDFKANSDSNLLATITNDELGVAGLKGIFSLVVPDQRSGKLELQYLHEYAGLTTSVGLTANPIVNMSGVIGTKALSFGADVAFDTANGNFTKYNAAISIVNADLIASLSLNNRGDGLSASYYHMVNSLKSTAVGAELVHSFSNNISTVIFGTQHAIDNFTLVKTRFNSYGKAGALVQHEWRRNSFVTVSAEMDTKSVEKSSKIGLAVILRP